ncbi:hypothetical protein [Nocardia seriolae]|uniref:Uncharacterized protein n=1 Tax=Nocardia seriolae TaxID=37332 RepID=A0A0B8NK81_9NOCA|nr:hypothetical protein [Nocardia seriolae]GEM27780.1 hypothetical protein NS2_60190 [Nocardia seriolae NBRC 15557]MTJ61728.1 hypothetical protein [Nocardia seriolae]MTK39697.1 hypothetical protein [Nocardia seriolae]QOW30722.1 hypothetical protein IMZ23_21350 [Nocardia seriolae]QUN15351.1 hypothetical protein KEC46_23555 [Nocardia seriolae]
MAPTDRAAAREPDPKDWIGLIFRILDSPRRTAACLALLLTVGAVAVLILGAGGRTFGFSLVTSVPLAAAGGLVVAREPLRRFLGGVAHRLLKARRPEEG